ncbi:MAG TPA: PEP-CTERM sorting domain-containing protein [Myxococcota bacterium]|nr:PEP-CTERM sorting domain-containing protein [Myxococcota bacterium]
MKGMRSLPLALVLCLVAASARAGQISVQFDFRGSSVSLLGGLIQVPPDGSITAAGGTLVASGLGSAAPVAGPAALQGFGMAATLNALTFGNTITGNPSLTQLGGAGGSLTAGLAQVLFASPMHVALAGAINCSGPSCAILSLPRALTGTQLLTLAAMPIANLASVGNALINATYAITLGGLTGSLHLVGTEVSRSYAPVPEPHTAGLLAIGLTLLAGWRAARSRR